MSKPVIWSCCLVLITLLSGCSQTPTADAGDDPSTNEFAEFDFRDERDPYEDFNRSMWTFNREVLDPNVILPVANTYERVPSPVRRGLYNVTDNLDELASIVNNLLQWKPKDSATSAGRFVVNTTFGVFGLFDVASRMGIERQKETFGETLATWGVPDGPYLMLPGIGPTVVLDRGGDLGDSFLWPAIILNTPLAIGRLAVRGLEQRIELKQLEPMLENTIDEYAFVREAYFSYWRDRVYDGNPPLEDQYDDWDDWDEWDDWESNEEAVNTFSLQWQIPPQ